MSPNHSNPSPEVRSLDVSRRSFLKQTAVCSAAVAAAPNLLGTASAQFPKSGATDAHVHVWTPELDRYPIDGSFTKQDMQPPSFTPEELFAHTKPAGVDRVVLIQMSFYRFDNRYMTDMIAKFPGVFRGVAVVDEHAADLADTVRKLAKQGVRGFRIHPAKQSVDAWIGSKGMADLWRIAADEQLAVCPLINPVALPAIGNMCKRFPKTRVVIDHFARIGIDGSVKDAELDALCRLAEFKTTFVKTSAFYALGKKKTPYTDLGPMIKRVRDAFGADRLMWASDCPYQVDPGDNYLDSIELVRSRLDFLSASDKASMLSGTAEKVFFS
ncbi:MAG: amidohydrolase family protein [Pirellulales bacterium]